MRLVSVNVGLPRNVLSHHKIVRTSIWKSPVTGNVNVSWLNLEGDQQADLSVHGGFEKAVYVYPREHYSYWRNELPGVEFPWGAFGENFTTEGLLESEVQIGDRFRIGSAAFIVTQPRVPCFKLGIRFGRADMVRRFFESRRTGFYLAVAREGEVAAGDLIYKAPSLESSLTIQDIFRLYAQDPESTALLPRASELAGLPDAWREYFRRSLLEFRGRGG